jgi:hypothetical protein
MSVSLRFLKTKLRHTDVKAKQNLSHSLSDLTQGVIFFVSPLIISTLAMLNVCHNHNRGMMNLFGSLLNLIARYNSFINCKDASLGS